MNDATTKEFIKWLKSKKGDPRWSDRYYYDDKHEKGFNSQIDEILNLVNKYSYTLELKEKLKSSLYALRRETQGCLSNRDSGREEAILCCLSYVHSNPPFKKG